MDPEKLIEAFGRGFARGLIEGQTPVIRPQKRRRRATRPPVSSTAPTQPRLDFNAPPPTTSEPEYNPLDPNNPVPSTLNDIVRAELAKASGISPQEREEMERALAGFAPAGTYIPEEVEGQEPWKAS